MARPRGAVVTWPLERVRGAVERGTLADWQRLADAIEADPWGPLACQVEEVIRSPGVSGPGGTVDLFRGLLDEARGPADRSGLPR